MPSSLTSERAEPPRSLYFQGTRCIGGLMIDPVRRLVQRYRYRVTGGECRLQRIIEQIVEVDEFGVGTDEPRVPFCPQETLLPPFGVAMLGAAPRSISAAIASQP